MSIDGILPHQLNGCGEAKLLRCVAWNVVVSPFPPVHPGDLLPVPRRSILPPITTSLPMRISLPRSMAMCLRQLCPPPALGMGLLLRQHTVQPPRELVWIKMAHPGSRAETPATTTTAGMPACRGRDDGGFRYKTHVADVLAAKQRSGKNIDKK